MITPRQKKWLAGLAAGLMAFGGLSLMNKTSGEVQPTPLPIILRQVQSLGELRTTRYSYDNVFEYRSSLSAADWAKSIPGVESVVRSTTRNTTLVSATGTIEAGIDLKMAQVERMGETLIVRLPSPKLEPPKVDAKVHWVKDGFFWRDNNLALKAQADAGHRFREASMQQGILQEAEKSARETLIEFLKPFAGEKVQIVIG